MAWLHGILRLNDAKLTPDAQQQSDGRGAAGLQGEPADATGSMALCWEPRQSVRAQAGDVL